MVALFELGPFIENKGLEGDATQPWLVALLHRRIFFFLKTIVSRKKIFTTKNPKVTKRKRKVPSSQGLFSCFVLRVLRELRGFIFLSVIEWREDESPDTACA